MATTLKSMATFTALGAGASASRAHGLNINGVSKIPDELKVDNPDFTVSADATNVTATNNGLAAANCNVLCEYWHTFDRAFGSSATTQLVPAPFVGGGGAGATNSQIAGLIYGTGQDGTAVLDGVNVVTWAGLAGSTYTLTRDVFLLDLTVAAGITLASGGYKIFVLGTATIAVGGIVSADGRNAAGGVAGGSSALGTLGIGVAGGAGRAANTGVAGTNQSNTLGDASAAGGAGGAGGVNAGGGGGTYTPSPSNGGGNYLTPLLTGFLFNTSSGGNQATVTIIGGGAGGGGGGSDNAGVTGGGGGGGGGVLVFHALTLVNNGLIRAKGGDGAAASGAGGNGGGGGGGGGGIILQLSRYRSGLGAVTVPGGAGGAPVAGGVAGAAGSTGHINAFAA
jgi:hypothetical protein